MQSFNWFVSWIKTDENPHLTRALEELRDMLAHDKVVCSDCKTLLQCCRHNANAAAGDGIRGETQTNPLAEPVTR